MGFRTITGRELGPQLHLGDRPSRRGFRSIAANHRGFVKPRGGFWTSSYLGIESGSNWIEFCRSDMPSWIEKDWWVVTPEPTARLLQIETLNDLKAIMSVYKSAHDSLFGDMWPDWFAISQDYDGVHLTEEGQWETRLSVPNLYGWDCESTLWLRWVFTADDPILVRTEELVAA